MRIPADPPRPADLLLSPLLLASLALLVVNDHALKPAFHDAVTGKLSDFAGVAALALVLRALLPRHRWTPCLLAGAAFVLWKSPASQPLVDAVNAAGWGPVGRVVDWTDLAALLVLPIALRHQPRRRTPTAARRALAPAVAVSCVLAFAATSRLPEPSSMPLYDEWSFAETPEALRERMYALGLGRLGRTGPPEPWGGRTADTLRMMVASADTGRAEWTAFVTVQLRPGVGGAGSVLRLLEVDEDLPVFSPDVVGFRFEREVVRPLREGAPPPPPDYVRRRIRETPPAP